MAFRRVLKSEQVQKRCTVNTTWRKYFTMIGLNQFLHFDGFFFFFKQCNESQISKIQDRLFSAVRVASCWHKLREIVNSLSSSFPIKICCLFKEHFLIKSKLMDLQIYRYTLNNQCYQLIQLILGFEDLCKQARGFNKIGHVQ